MQEGEITGHHHHQESMRFDDMNDSADIVNNMVRGDELQQPLYREPLFRNDGLESMKALIQAEVMLPLTNTVTILSDPVQAKSQDYEPEEQNLQMRWSESSAGVEDEADIGDDDDDDDEDQANISVSDDNDQPKGHKIKHQTDLKFSFAANVAA